MQNYICRFCGNSFEAAPDSEGMIVCAFCGSEMPEKDAESPLAPGTKINGYEILRHLGSGGSADVYLAEQSLMERKVALKLLKTAGMGPGSKERFFEEARKTAMFDNPHMVSVLDMGTSEEGYCYLATRYLEGETLEALLARGQTFSEEKALWIVFEVASALSAVWDKHNMFHRDIKPGNIMLTSGGEVMILDMGIAQSYGENSLVDGEVEGSPYYMSPEQARGDKLFWSTDLYSLGVTLFQMLTGKYPYDAPTVGEILELHHNAPFPALAEIAPHVKISDKVEALLRRMMGKTPAARFTSWKEFLSVVSSIRKELAGKSGKISPEDAVPEESPETGKVEAETFRPLFRRQVFFLTCLTFFLLAVLCGGLFLYLASRTNSRYADQCLLEAAEVVREKDWKSEQLESILDEFQDVVLRFGVNPSVRRRFMLYRKEASERKKEEQNELHLLEKMDLALAEILAEVQSDLDSIRKKPLSGPAEKKRAAYQRVLRKIYAGRNRIAKIRFLFAESRNRKRLAMIRLNRAAGVVYHELNRVCGPAGKTKKPAVPVPEKKNPPARKAVPGKKTALAVKKNTPVQKAGKPSAVKTPVREKVAVRNVKRRKGPVPQQKQKVLVLTASQKKFLRELFAQEEKERFSERNPLLRRIRPVRGPEQYWRSLMRTLLQQGRSFYFLVYDSGKTFTNTEIRVGELNRILKIFSIHKDRIYFRNVPVVFTFSRIHSGDWYDFLRSIAEKKGVQKQLEAYLLLTENGIILEEKTVRNPVVKRLLPGIKKIQYEIREEKKDPDSIQQKKN